MRLRNLRIIILGIGFAIATWFLLYYLEIFSPLLFPSPIDVFADLSNLFFSGAINDDILVTLYRLVIGFALGIFFGVPFGLLMGSSKLFHDLFEFPLDFFRSLPVTALFPLFLLFFGVGDLSKIAMVFAFNFPVMVINSAYGVLHSSKKRILMAKSFGATKLFIFRKIIFWESLPQTFVGMRLALSISLIIVIVAEMFLGTQTGLGQKLFDAYSTNLVERLFAIILVIGLLGYFLNKIFLVIERRILTWKGK